MLHKEVDLEEARNRLHASLRQYPPNDMGLFYIELFAAACHTLQNSGEIDGVEIYEKFSPQDLRGVDAAINVRGERIRFQVTSTATQVVEHRRVFKRNPDRPPVHFLSIRRGDLPLLKSERIITREIRQRIKRGKYR